MSAHDMIETLSRDPFWCAVAIMHLIASGLVVGLILLDVFL